jgi:large subunit ribosomal protein L13
MKTYSPKAADLQPQWHLIDASGKALGRLATEVATLLIGKRKTTYAPHMNTGDFVIVVNASKIRLSGSKAKQKVYYRHSNYPGGLKSVPYEKLVAGDPTRVIEHAVKGMIPQNRLGRAMMKRLKVYAGDNHPHKVQLEIHEGAEAHKGEGRSKRGRS